MITNFERVTEVLTEEEKRLIKVLIKGFSSHNETNPIKAHDILMSINDKKDLYGMKKKLTGERLRKMVNFIRSNSILPLIATSDGYFVTKNKDILNKQVQSLNERAGAIMNASNGLEKFLINSR